MEDASVKIFPDPASDIVIVEMNKNVINPISIAILNTDGKVLKTEVVNVTDGKLSLDVSNLLNGIYFLKIKEGEGMYNLKFAMAK